MINILETNSSSYDWANGKVKAVETTDLVCPEVANVAPTELALRTANLNGRTTNLEIWKNTLTNADSDSIVNTYEEMRSFFASVPEGTAFPTEIAKRVDRSENLTTTFSGGITGTYNNNNETLLKFIDVVHTTQQTSFTLTLQNSNNCNLDLRLRFFTNLILNVPVIMEDGTTIAAGANIPVLSTATNLLLNISGWGGNWYLTFERVNNTLTGTRGYVGLSEAQGKELNDRFLCYGQVGFSGTTPTITKQGGVTTVGINKFSLSTATQGGAINQTIITHNASTPNICLVTGINSNASHFVLNSIDNNSASVYQIRTPDSVVQHQIPFCFFILKV